MFGFMTLCAESAERKFEGDWTVIWSTVVTGLVVVFLILLILVFILMLMGKIMTVGTKKPDAAKTLPAKSVPQTVAPVAAEEEYEEDDGEIIAVISAAVAAYGEADGKQYRVVGVKKRDRSLRSGWSAAGISENTRPF